MNRKRLNYKQRIQVNQLKAYKEIIEFIGNYVNKHSMAPTDKIIADSQNVTITAVKNRIKQMMGKGLVTRIFKQQRSIVVTKKGIKFINS